MKRRLFVFLLSLSILFVLGGCNSTLKDSSNTLEITQTDEKIIQEYLDTKTNDISSPYRGGKMYSAFRILGTDSNKIYVWMLKYENLKQSNELTNGVSIPIVLYIETKGDKIEIDNHKYPKDGVEYGRSLGKLFPQNVRDEMSNNNNELIGQLEEIIRNRIKSDTGI
ncbi:MAG: hypothetical protein AB2417_10410 [Clostridiaceae bacterium]